MSDERIPSAVLRLADVPTVEEGWSQRASEFAHTFDGYAYVDGGPVQLWQRLVEPVFDTLSRSGGLPPLGLDDLRAVIFYLARADRQGGGYGLEGVELDVYLAAIAALREALAATDETRTRDTGSR